MTACGPAQRLQTDAELTQWFNAHRDDVIRLTAMMTDDIRCWGVNARFTSSGDLLFGHATPPCIEAGRRGEYRALFGRVNVREVALEPGRIVISLSAVGNAHASVTKGIAYLSAPPAIIEDLDRSEPQIDGTLYKRIEDGWYAFKSRE